MWSEQTPTRCGRTRLRSLKPSEHDADDHTVQIEPMRRADDGTSIVEILIAIVLTGTLVLAVVNSLATAVGTSSASFVSAETSTVLLNASDRINRAPQLCDYEAYVDAAAIAEGWDPSLITVSIERLVANTGAASDWEPQPCPADVSAFDVQRLTITATDPTGQVSKTLTVVKSDVS